MTSHTQNLGVLLLASALFTFGGCARHAQTAQPESGLGIGPGPMLAPTAIAQRFLWRQRVTASWDGRSESFDTVLQMDGAELILMGLGPLGRPGFIAKLGGSGLSFDNRSGRSLPFAPEHIMADVQKVFYPWLPPIPAGFTGTRMGGHETLMISETYANGRLVARSFQRSDALDRGELRVRYEGWQPGLPAPQRATLDNAWFGYRLTIVTVDQQRLPDQAIASGESNR